MPSLHQLPTAPASDHGIRLRPLETPSDFDACLALQEATWGAGFREAVPAAILKVVQRLGGVAAGAFDADGSLLGFVFGMTGVERGRLVHWSDMLAVRGDVQNRGIGRLLKEHQRDIVRALGVERMYWTFDPLVARNAHLNLTRLGARVVEYVPDMYGTGTGSSLHEGIGTDRLVVVWPLGDRSAEDRDARGDAWSTSPSLPGPVLNPGSAEWQSVDPARFGTVLPLGVRIEIPDDIRAVQQGSPSLAAHWRKTTRRAFQWALANDYVVDRFVRDPVDARACYLLTHTSSPATQRVAC